MKKTNKVYELPLLNKKDFFEMKKDSVFEKSHKQIKCEWKGYVKFYNRTATIEKVEEKIRHYLEKLAETQPVKEFLQVILDDQELLAKNKNRFQLFLC